MPHPSADFLMPLWWTLGICLVVLTLSSFGEVVRRAMEMSGRPVGELAVVLPAVFSKTHFGRVWLLRPVALVVLWPGWGRRRRLDSPGSSAAMLAAACLIAASRSLSGHAADWGDITLPELVDWTHLLAVSLWDGSLRPKPLPSRARPCGSGPSGSKAPRKTASISSSAVLGASLAIPTGRYNASPTPDIGTGNFYTLRAAVRVAYLPTPDIALAAKMTLGLNTKNLDNGLHSGNWMGLETRRHTRPGLAYSDCTPSSLNSARTTRTIPGARAATDRSMPVRSIPRRYLALTLLPTFAFREVVVATLTLRREGNKVEVPSTR